ncbi:hypothetical protein AZE42_10376 [Rhizopogon vesiculosus]|uniref:Nudix hydrolase domain-containing protein n=1 Tax=Rhizopogon vesiculosus TaxID=180088 RepID=A0A1J8QYP5_9AGAM|nr:hypothetical protein AZE42_10376 [Rhizopogon vesiculosus]
MYALPSSFPALELDVNALYVGLTVLAMVVMCLKTYTMMALEFSESTISPMANADLERLLRDIPAHALKPLTSKSKACIQRLRTCQIDRPDLSRQPRRKLAAVLVLLYEQSGELRVLLTTRSKSLRAHPGQTALPGGKADDTDGSLIWTAFREANEEVGLPLPSTSSNIHFVTTLPPFLSTSQLLVMPVVAFSSSLSSSLLPSSPLVSDSSSNSTSDKLSSPSSHPILSSLTPSLTEVDRIFDHPLEAMLDPQLILNNGEPLVGEGEDWPYGAGEVHNTTDVRFDAYDGLIYRMHRFRTCASPIKGLTADILTSVAELAYGRKPVYGQHPSNSEDDQGETYRAVVNRRIAENEMALKTLEGGGKV